MLKKREQLRQEWKDVVLLFIDEVSLMDAGLFAEIDAALRFATENYDEYFGGIFLVITGDFNQLPPVGGSPLYKPIRSAPSSESQAEIERRIGRMAWKRFDTVINLTEQKRMSSDPEFGEAILRLRNRECTQDDVDLFNSRRIKSWDHLSGLELSEKKYYDASAIVATNLKRQVLNQCKTEAICSAPSGPSLIECVAYNEVMEITAKSATDSSKSKFLAKDAEEPGFHIRTELIKLNFSSQDNRILPGSVQLYVGMRVVLKSFNLCTELGVTNGSLGILKHIHLETCQSGFTYATAALVEFPDSSVSIPGLPDKWFPIMPQSSSFTITINDENGVPRKLKCFRKQLPLQSSSTITAHFAQGQTMDSVLTSFKDGPAAAYVSASRAVHRNGLFLLEEIQLHDLNSPKLSLDLRYEYQQLEAIEHNTLVQWGFLASDLVSVPDIEGENLPDSLRIKFTVDVNTVPGKRKRTQTDDSFSCSDQRSKKVILDPVTESSHQLTVASPLPLPSHCPSLPGCVWDNQNWSCVYDTALTLLTYVFREATPEFREKWKSLSVHTFSLLALFMENEIHQDANPTCSTMNTMRERLRDYLTSYSPSQFVHTGAHMASCSSILELFTVPLTFEHQCLVPFSCLDHNTEFIVNFKIPLSLIPTNNTIIFGSNSSELRPLTVQHWLSMLVDRSNSLALTLCPEKTNHSDDYECHLHPLSTLLDCLSPFILIELPEQPYQDLFQICASIQIFDHLPIVYNLSAVVLLGSSHFSSRIYLKNETYFYDG
ncbi:hypothetical protein D9758_016196 [Tetrapyrgos nigripes]|uniref:ATP-dependent DNA helicase n=1 Tax=Tetrapyrgos nigripes TaxID=182062 RepID=A0A8H5C6R4_9AGAR|nr:hypothetical protein D9758_016196 [Tetrapyrgos nigripes]